MRNMSNQGIQLVIPAFMGFYMYREDNSHGIMSKATCGLHIFTVLLGSFLTVAGTYTVVQSIIDAYKAGNVGGAFSCS